jgi:hypothetical protein
LHATVRAIARALRVVPKRPEEPVQAEAESPEAPVRELPPPLPPEQMTAGARGLQDALRQSMQPGGETKES